MRSFLTPPLDNPWRDWKINPVGNVLALLGALAYIGGVLVPVFGSSFVGYEIPIYFGIFS